MGSINADYTQRPVMETPEASPGAYTTQQSGGDRRPPLERRKSAGVIYTPHQEDKLCRKLKFFFMGPHEKVKAKRRCPWKLLIQIVKIILVTTQVIQFGFIRSRFVDYTEKLTVSLKHLYLRDWTNSYETMPYPPAAGVYAIYKIDSLVDHINFAMKAYYETEQNTIGSLKFVMNTTDNKPKKIRLCRKFYKKGKIYDNGTYNIDAEIAENCQPVSGFKNSSGDWVYDIVTYLNMTYNETILTDRLLLVTLRFSLRTFRLDMNERTSPPQCFMTNINVTFDDSNKDGQMLVNLDTLLKEQTCKGNFSNRAETQAVRKGYYALDAIVITVTVFSMILCSRSVVRAQLLRIKTMKFFKHRYGKPLSLSDQMEFLNLWYVTIIINDVLTIVGSGYKIQLEGRNMESSSTTYDVCGVMLGTGSLLAWLGVLRYIGFFEQFNILILTLKRAFPSMLRFLACCIMLYIGFVVCGWVVLGPYHIKFRHMSTASECLFSLINGDDMFVTFSATETNNELVWYYSRIYLYVFNSLFIYAVLNLFLAVIMDTYETIKKYYSEGFPKSELFEFIDRCTDPAHSPIYRKEDRSICDNVYTVLCCCKGRDPDHPDEYTSLIR